MENRVLTRVVCRHCGNEEMSSESYCTACGEKLLEKGRKAREKTEKGPRFLDIVWSILMTSAILFLTMAVFLQAVLRSLDSFSSVNFSSDWMMVFFGHWYALAMAFLFLLLLLVTSMLINRKALSRSLFIWSLSFLMSGISLYLLGLFSNVLIKSLPVQWQSILINQTLLFREYSSLLAMILFSSGAVFLSIYSCIKILEGYFHEKTV